MQEVRIFRKDHRIALSVGYKYRNLNRFKTLQKTVVWNTPFAYRVILSGSCLPACWSVVLLTCEHALKGSRPRITTCFTFCEKHTDIFIWWCSFLAADRFNDPRCPAVHSWWKILAGQLDRAQVLQ